MDVVGSLVDESEIDREEAVMDEHENRVTHISVSLNGLSSYAKALIKAERKELYTL